MFLKSPLDVKPSTLTLQSWRSDIFDREPLRNRRTLAVSIVVDECSNKNGRCSPSSRNQEHLAYVQACPCTSRYAWEVHVRLQDRVAKSVDRNTPIAHRQFPIADAVKKWTFVENR